VLRPSSFRFPGRSSHRCRPSCALHRCCCRHWAPNYRLLHQRPQLRLGGPSAPRHFAGSHPQPNTALSSTRTTTATGCLENVLVGYPLQVVDLICVLPNGAAVARLKWTILTCKSTHNGNNGLRGGPVLGQPNRLVIVLEWKRRHVLIHLLPQLYGGLVLNG
jgi:hypothetical protein